ncbi:MAG: hypothetical protein FWH29_03600 [Methanobrevibacter sp.]|nr:hypothetical protein [Methanobrevibacter sp.]
MNIKKILVLLIFAIAIVGFTLTTVASAKYDGSYYSDFSQNTLDKAGSNIYSVKNHQGTVYVAKSKNYYAADTKANLKNNLNKIDKIVIKLQRPKKTETIKTVTKPKNGWKVKYYAEEKYDKTTKELTKTGKFNGYFNFNFKTASKVKINRSSDKGIMQGYGKKGNLLFKSTCRFEE